MKLIKTMYGDIDIVARNSLGGYFQLTCEEITLPKHNISNLFLDKKQLIAMRDNLDKIIKVRGDNG